MTTTIKSKIDPTKTLFVFHSPQKDSKTRINLVPPDQFIQCSVIKPKVNTEYRAHRHIEQKRTEPKYIPQEAWVVMSGEVLVTIYDLDNSRLQLTLKPGDCGITLYAGHKYEITKPNTLVYEFKTGKYLGQELDKVFINE